MSKMPPLLTIIIPAYNVEKTIKQCLDSLIDINDNLVEVIVINDGSTDRTEQIVSNYSEKYPFIKIINKPNGGHGSTINTGIIQAHGKYFRILDGDDWIDKKTFTSFLKRLKEESADIVLTEHYLYDDKTHKSFKSHDYDNIQPNSLLELESIRFKKDGPTLPNTTIKTSILKSFSKKIDEKSYYVDQEFNFICYTQANTVIKYNLPTYYYRVNQVNQSMSRKNLINNISSHEKVCLWLLDNLYDNRQKLEPNKLHHLSENIIVPLCNLQYEIAVKNKKSKKDFLSFDKKLKKYPQFYNHYGIAGNIINFHRKTKGNLLFLDPLLTKLGKLKKL